MVGRDVCFCLTSSREMPPEEALARYRAKDAVEKLFHSLESEIVVRPIRVWSEYAVLGILLLGFIAQLMVSLTRWTVGPPRTLATKFIASSLEKLTVTMAPTGEGRRGVLFELRPSESRDSGESYGRDLTFRPREQG